MNAFLNRLAMLVLFLLAFTCAWSAVSMVFEVSLFNILLGILAIFFLLRGLEIADKINNLGPYSETGEGNNTDKPDVQESSSGEKNSDEERLPE